MYVRFIGFAINKNAYRSRTASARVYPSNLISSLSTHPDIKFVDDIREPTGSDERVNVVKSSRSSTSEGEANGDGDMADTAKQGVVKAMETGLDIGEMAKKTLDNVFDATKETTDRVREAVAGDPEEKNEVPPTDQFVDDLRKHADGYDLKKK